MNVVLLITIYTLLNNGLEIRDTREVSGIPTFAECYFFAEVARKQAEADTDVALKEISTICVEEGKL